MDDPNPCRFKAHTFVLSLIAACILTAGFSLHAEVDAQKKEQCASQIRKIEMGLGERFVRSKPVALTSRLVLLAYDLVFPKGQLRKMGEVKLFDLSPEVRAKKLIRYIRALDLAATEEINEATYYDFRWIIKQREHLKEQNFLIEENLENSFPGKSKSEVDLDDAVQLLKAKQDQLFERIRMSRDLRVLNFFIGSGWRLTLRPRTLILSGMLLGAGMQIGSAAFNRWVLPAVAATQKESFRKSHEATYGERSPLVPIEEREKDQMWEFISRHQSTLDLLQSPGRDDKIKIPQVIHQLGLSLSQARNVQHDTVQERILLKDLWEVDLWTKDYTGAEFGANTRDEIDHLYDLYDPDGSIRREFQAELQKPR